MKKYNVNVNGGSEKTTYYASVGYNDVGGLLKEAAAPAPAPVAAPAGAGEQVKSPMPGNILSVNVNVGDTVAEGQVLMILEAMKMENEIMAPKAGKVTSVNVQKGATVESGTLLCVVG